MDLKQKNNLNSPYFESKITALITWLGEGLEARGQTGHVQSSTEREASVKAKVAWTVETRRLQNSKDRFGKNFLKRWNAVVHEMIPNVIILKIRSSICCPSFFSIKNRSKTTQDSSKPPLCKQKLVKDKTKKAELNSSAKLNEVDDR